MSNTNIPSSHIEFCKDVALLAQRYRVDSVSLQFRPGFDDIWSDEIQMSWEQGRHGEDSGRLVISSTVVVRAEL